MGLLSTLKVKLTADISEYADRVREARQHATSLSTGLGGVGAGIERMGDSLTRVATIAAGQLVATGITRLATAVAGAGREAVASVADYERLGASLTALTAKEILNNSVKVESIATGAVKRGLTEKEALAQSDLTIKMLDYQTSIKVAEERLAKYIATGKHSKAEIQDQTNKLEGMRRKYGDMSGELATLDKKSGTMVTTFKTTTTQTMTMAQAQLEAAGKVKEQLGWVQKLAIESPFTRTDVAQAFKQAMAYGFTADQAKELTQSVIDFASANGASGDTMGRITLALGQMKAKGRVMGGELLQLTEAGVGTNEILAKMGVNLKDVENGTVSAEKFIAAFNSNVQKDFGGAAKAQSGTFAGLLSSLQDLKDIALRTVFTPLFTAFKPILDGIVTKLQSPEAAKFFENIGNAISKPLSAIKLFQVLTEQGIEPISALRTVITTTLGPDATKVFDDIARVVQDAFGWFTANRTTIEGVLTGIGAAFAAIGVILAASNIYGAIVAIGAVLATISLPVVLIVAAVGLLAAAWATNFGGIRDTLTQVWNGTLQPALAQLWTWLQVNIPIAIAALATFWETTLKPAFEAVGTFIATKVVPVLSDIVTWLSVNVPIAVDILVGFWNNTLLPAFTAVWDWLNANLFPTLGSLANLLGNIVGKNIEILAGLWDNVLVPALKTAWKWLSENIEPAWKAITAAIGVLNPQLKKFIDDPLKALQEGLRWVESLLATVKKLFDDFASGVTNFKLPDFLVRHSPSPLEQTFMGVAAALKDIHTIGMPDWGSFQPPAYAMPGIGVGGSSGERDVKIDISVGNVGDGLELADVARAFGREVARRL